MADQSLAPIINSFITNYGWRIAYRYVGIIIIAIACPVVFFLLRLLLKKWVRAFGCGLGENEKDKKKALISNEGNVEISPNDVKNKAFFWIFMIGFFGMGLVCSAPMRQMNPYISDIYGSEFAASVIGLSSLMGIFENTPPRPARQIRQYQVLLHQLL